MKKLVMAMLITAAAITTTVNAQPPKPGGRDMQPPHPPRDEHLQPVSQFQGSVVKMSTNDDYVYDGFYMLNGSDSLLVKFPPHLGNQIAPLVKNGANVTVSGTLNYPSFGGKEIRMVSLTANGNTIYDAPPSRAPVLPAETFVKGSGKISATQTDREGRLNGFILDNKTILHIPPQVAAQIDAMAKTGAGIDYTGMQKTAKQGEVMAADYTIVHCNTITVNGQQYAVEGPGERR